MNPRLRPERTTLLSAGRHVVGAAVVFLLAGLLSAVAVGTTAPAGADTPASGGTYVALTPARVLDTRIGLGAPQAAVPARGSLSFTVTGVGGVPDAGDVSAVVFNLTATNTAALGYISAYPAGQAVPTTSTLNFAAGETRAHEVVVAPGTGGQVTLLNGSDASVDLAADVSGYYTAGAPSAAGEFAPLAPARLLDTRIGLGAPTGPVVAGGRVALKVAGRGGVPATGVSAVLLNLTVTQPTVAGYLTTESFGTSNLNFQGATTASNLVVAPLLSDGTVAITPHFVTYGKPTVQAVADVFGYYLAGSPTAAGRLGAIAPVRLLDTRLSGEQPIPAHASVTLPVAGHGGIPATGITAAALNLTVASPTGSGYLTAYPSGVDRPDASTVNFAGRTLANLSLVSLGSDGAVTIYNGSSATQNVVVDATAVVGPLPAQLTWSARTTFAAGADVTALSCASATFCLAADGTHVLRFNGTVWSAPQVVGTETLTAISCVSTTFCLAMADDAAYRYNGSTWTRTPVGDVVPIINTVSCVSALFCLAGGSRWDVPHVWAYNGSTWTDSLAGIPGGESQVISVDCVSPSFCVATDADHNAEIWNGSTWTVHANVASSVNGAGRVSCASASFCQDVDGAQAAVFNGSDWLPAVDLQVGRGSEANAISCPSATFCIAPTEWLGGLLVYDGTSWSAAATVDPAIVNSLGIQAVSCPSVSFCVAVDQGGAVIGRR